VPIEARIFVATAKKVAAKPQTKVDQLIALARAAPSTSPSTITKIHKDITGGSSKKKKANPSYMSHGPSQKQVLVTFGVKEIKVLQPNFAVLQCNLNRALVSGNSPLCIEAGKIEYGGWTLQTNNVANDREIGYIRSVILSTCAKRAIAVRGWSPRRYGQTQDV
jgi:hypothetical protein